MEWRLAAALVNLRMVGQEAAPDAEQRARRCRAPSSCDDAGEVLSGFGRWRKSEAGELGGLRWVRDSKHIWAPGSDEAIGESAGAVGSPFRARFGMCVLGLNA